MIVGEAFISINADSSTLGEQVEAQTSAALGASDLTEAGEVAGADLGAGIRTGAKDDLDKLAKDGETAGAGLAGGVRKGAEKDLDGLAKDGEKAGSDFGSSLSNAIGNALSGLSGVFGKVGGDLGPLSAGIGTVGDKMKDADGKGSGFISALSNLGGKVALGAAAGLAVFSLASIKMASDYQSTVATIAANAGIPESAAQKIGNAFLTTAGTTIYSATEIGKSYASIAGQAQAMAGHVLKSKTALALMKVSMDLAEGSGSKLATTSKTLVSTLQTFQLPLKNASAASDVLFSTARVLGTTITTVGGSFTRLRGQLGTAAPSIQELGGLFTDLAQHGEANSRAMRSVTTSLAGLLTPSAAVVKAQTQMHVSFINSAGQLTSLGNIFTKVQPLISGMGNAQATATLKALGFGSASNKLVSTIQAGTPALFDATVAASKVGSAHEAAAKQAKTLAHQMDLMKASVEDLAVKFGSFLIPKLEKLFNFLLTHKPILEALGITIGVVLVAAFAAWAISAATAAAATLAASWPILVIIAAIALLAVGIYELVKHWTAVWGAIKSVAASVWHFIENNVLHPIENFFTKTLPSIFNSVIAFLKHWGPLIGELILVPFTGGLSIILPLVIKYWGTIVGFFESIPGKLLNALESFGGLILGWLRDAWNYLLDALKDYVNLMLDIYVKIPLAIIDKIIGFAGMLVGWAADAFSKLLGAIVAGWNVVSGWFAGLPGMVIAFFVKAATWLVQGGMNILTGLWNGLKLAWATVSNWVGDIYTDFLKGFDKALTWLESAGSNIIKGLLNGLKKGWTDVLNFLKKAATKVKTFLDNPLSILSPSKVMTEKGTYIFAGLGRGMTKGYTKHVVPVLNAATSGILRSLEMTSSNTDLGHTLSPSSGTTHVTQITIAPGAVSITVPTGAHAGEAKAAVTDAFTQLSRELNAGQAPLRVNR